MTLSMTLVMPDLSWFKRDLKEKLSEKFLSLFTRSAIPSRAVKNSPIPANTPGKRAQKLPIVLCVKFLV